MIRRIKRPCYMGSVVGRRHEKKNEQLASGLLVSVEKELTSEELDFSTASSLRRNGGAFLVRVDNHVGWLWGHELEVLHPLEQLACEA